MVVTLFGGPADGLALQVLVGVRLLEFPRPDGGKTMYVQSPDEPDVFVVVRGT